MWTIKNASPNFFRASFFVYFHFFSFTYVYLCFKWNKTQIDVRKKTKIDAFKKVLTPKHTKRHKITPADIVWQIDYQYRIRRIKLIRNINFWGLLIRVINRQALKLGLWRQKYDNSFKDLSVKSCPSLMCSSSVNSLRTGGK